MSTIKRIKDEKPAVIFHKIKFLISKRIQRLIDRGLLKRKINISFVPRDSFRTICINASDCDKADILSRKFFWLGMEGKQIQEGEWHTDFLSGFKWHNQYYQKIITVDLSTNADVKVPWELSRLQHLTRLAIIAKQEGTEESTSLYIKSEILSWIDCNPYKESVNWTCAMEVAIRAVNMVFIALLLPNQLFRDEVFYKEFIKILFCHGLFIIRNLETYDEYYNNHYLSDLLGLQWIGLFCEEHLSDDDKRVVKKWYSFAHKELESECQKQVFLDGTDYESSIAYHRYVTELFCLSVYIDRIYAKEPGISILNTLPRMIGFMEEVRMPDGILPMIGDSDDGRVLIFENYSHWNKSSTDFLLERIDQYIKGDLSIPLLSVSSPSMSSVAYEDSGYYLLRNDKVYCLTHCGPLSLHGHGGHSHNDQLSVIIAFKGIGFIVDSGTGSYSGYPDLRNYFRSTKAHSTVEVIGHEQNELIKDSLYKMREKTFSSCLEFSDGAFSGEHYGFKDIGIKHKRNISMGENSLLIEDFMTGCNNLNVQWSAHYILDSDVVASQINETEFELKKRGVTVILQSNVDLTIEKTIISKEYGNTENTFKISTIPSRMENIYTKFIIGGN